MGSPCTRFAVGLQAAAGLFEQRRHGAVRYRMILPGEFFIQRTKLRANPCFDLRITPANVIADSPKTTNIKL
jgi:hypothetical protein